MNEIEKAIRRLESCSIIPFDQDSQEVCGLAIEALREKQEREKGCYKCRTKIFTKRISAKENGKLFSYVELEHNFCPVCGRDLRKGKNDG